MEPAPKSHLVAASDESPQGGALIVGREYELSVLAEHLEAAGRGHGGVVLIAGEAGVGKSRLLSEFSNKASTSGWLVLTGHAYETEGMSPYLPFIGALQEYVRTMPLDDLRGQLGEAAPEVGLLLPDVLRRLPDVTSSSPLEPLSQRYRLFEGVSTFLAAVSRSTGGGLLLCLEDLHWADEATLLLLYRVSRRLATAPLLIVATYRDTELDRRSPLARALEQLARRDGLRRLQLKRLTREEAGSMLEVLGRPDPPAKMVDAFYDETEGNPFFMREVFQYLSEAGRLFDSAGVWRQGAEIGAMDVPHSARLVVGRRLESVSVDCRHVLSLAAVIGRTFNYELLLAVAELDEAALLDVIDQAVAANLLASSPQGISFTHELIRQTLFSNLSLPRQQAIHLRIAGAIEELYASDLDSHLADLAAHYRSAQTSVALEKAIDYAKRAGDRAAMLLAFEEALRLYDIALATNELRGPEQRAALPEILIKRAEVLVSLARWQESRAAYQAAASHVTGERRAMVLLGLAGAALLPGIDIPLARGAAEEALLLSRDLGSIEMAAAATALVAECDLNDGKIASALIQYEQAYSQVVDIRLPHHRQFLSFPRALYWAGRIDEAVERGRDNVIGARRVQDEMSDIASSTDFGVALAASGHYVEAREAFEHARTKALGYGAVGVRPLLARAIAMSCVIPIALFDDEHAEALAEEARDIARSANSMLTYVSEGIDLMCVYGRRGELDRADAMAIEVGDLLHHGVGSHGPIWASRLAEAKAGLALMRGRLPDAFVLAESALDLARSIGRPKYEALSLCIRGKALVGMGKKREGIADLRQAIEVVRPMGDPAMFLRTSAALLAVDGNDVLASEARDAVDRTLANLPEDMKPGFQAAEPVRLVYAHRSKASGQAPRVIYPDGLTEREVEVLRLIAAGRSNQQIADALVISVNTAARHVSSILGKTGAASRGEAASYAHRNQFV